MLILSASFLGKNVYLIFPLNRLSQLVNLPLKINLTISYNRKTPDDLYMRLSNIHHPLTPLYTSALTSLRTYYYTDRRTHKQAQSNSILGVII